MNQWTRIPLFVIVLCFCLGSATIASGQAATKKPISYDVYDSWRSIEDPQLSRDGTWLVYSLMPQDGDGELVARNLKTNVEHRHTRGKVEQERRRGPDAPPRSKDVVITVDGKYVVFNISPSKAELDEAKKKKKKPEQQPKKGLGILDLASGEVVTVERVKSFKVPEESGDYVAYLLEPPEEKPGEKPDKEEKEGEPEDEKEGKKEEKKPGSDLVIRNLAAATESTIHEVAEYALTEDGSWLAYSVSSKEAVNDGSYARQVGDGTTRTLLSGLGNYKSLAFDEDGGQFAFLSDRDDYESDKPIYKLYHWSTSSDAAC